MLVEEAAAGLWIELVFEAVGMGNFLREDKGRKRTKENGGGSKTRVTHRNRRSRDARASGCTEAFS